MYTALTWDHYGQFEVELMEDRLAGLKINFLPDVTKVVGTTLKVDKGRLSKWLTGFRVYAGQDNALVAAIPEAAVYAVRDERGELLWTGLNFIVYRR